MLCYYVRCLSSCYGEMCYYKSNSNKCLISCVFWQLSVFFLPCHMIWSSSQRLLLWRYDPQPQFHRKRHEHHFVLNNWFTFNWFSGEQDGQQTKPTGWKQAYCFKQTWNSLIMTLILYFCFAVSRSVSRGRVFSFTLLLTNLRLSLSLQNITQCLDLIK